MPLIALIDDLPINRAIFAQLARNLADDIEIISFSNGSEALTVLRDTMPDLVITDYNMPGMNGAEFIERFRLFPNCADIPVIVITIHGERNWKLAALAAGATDFLNSPVDHLEFATRARNLLQLRRHQLLLEKRLGHLTSRLATSRVSHAHSTQDAHRQLDQIINALPVLISAVDAQGQIIFCNAAYAAFYGIKPQSESRSPRHNRGEKPSVELSSQDRLLLQTGIVPAPFTQFLEDKTGKNHSFTVYKSVLTDRQGRVRAILNSAAASDPSQGLSYAESPVFSAGPLQHQGHFRHRLQDAIAKERREGFHAALHLIQLAGPLDPNASPTPSDVRNYMTIAARHIGLMLREADILGTWNETTFAVLQRHVTGPQDALKFAQRLQFILRDCGSLIENAVAKGTAIGIALVRSGLQDLIDDAELALKTAQSDFSVRLADPAGDFGAPMPAGQSYIQINMPHLSAEPSVQH